MAEQIVLNREFLLKNIPEASQYKDDDLEKSAFLQMALATKYLGKEYLTEGQVRNILEMHKI